MRRLFPLLLLAGCVVDQTAKDSPESMVDVGVDAAGDPADPGERDPGPVAPTVEPVPGLCGVPAVPYERIQPQGMTPLNPPECDADSCEGDAVCGGLGRCVTPISPEFESLSLRRADGVVFARGLVVREALRRYSMVADFGGQEHVYNIGWTITDRLTLDAFALVRSDADTAQVWLIDQDEERTEGVEVPIVDMPIRGLGDVCDGAGFDDWCGRGATCARVEGDFVCVGVQTSFWRDGDSVTADITTDRPIDGWSLNAIRIGERLASPRRVDSTRWLARTFLEGQRDFRHSGHLIAEVAPRRAVERNVGEVCDMERVADACPRDSACKAGVCKAITAPVVREGRLLFADGGFGVVLKGVDPDQDLVALRFDADELYELELNDTENKPNARSNAVLSSDGANFTLYWSHDGDAPVARRMLVTLIDVEGLESEPFDLIIEDAPAPTPARIGTPCDLAGVLFGCGGGLVCDRTDCDPTVVCRRPLATCEDHDDVELVNVAQGSMAGAATGTTNISCRVNSGLETYYAFTAGSAGRYRVQLESQMGNYLYLAARRSCDQPGIATSEVFCSPIEEAMAGGDIELAEGERITVIVAAHWTRSLYEEPYRVLVRRLD